MEAACKSKHIESHSWLHFGRKTVPAMMDLEKVSDFDKRALGNWATYMFGEIYTLELPLAAMRFMTGFDKRSERYQNSCTTFMGISLMQV